MKVFDNLKTICKSPYWQAMLDRVEELINLKHLRLGESILSITPYDSGIRVILRGEDIVHVTPWREMWVDNPPQHEYVTFKTRTVHIWRGQLERGEGYYYELDDKWYKTRQELVDAYNADFGDTHSVPVTVDNWTEEEWNTIWKP